MMPHYTDYRCGTCGINYEHDKEQLNAKVIVFKKIGPRGKVVRSRTVAWKCNICMLEDADYQISAHMSPGQRSPARDRIRSAEREVS